MSKKYIEDETFEHIDFSENALEKADYEKCMFCNCNFSNCDLSCINFIECVFLECNLSLAIISQTAFREVQFKNCKLLGLHFDECNSFLFEVGFDNCTLNLSSFYKLKLKKTNFKNCSMHEVDFSETDLTEAVLEQCDLLGAIFQNSILEKTDFRTAFNFSFDPELNRMKKAKFSLQGIAGLLHKYQIEIEN